MKTEQTTTPVTLDQFGDVLSREEVVRVFRFQSVNALYSRVKAQRFPAPAMTCPMRWFKADLQRWMNGDLRVTQIRRRA